MRTALRFCQAYGCRASGLIVSRRSSRPDLYHATLPSPPTFAFANAKCRTARSRRSNRLAVGRGAQNALLFRRALYPSSATPALHPLQPLQLPPQLRLCPLRAPWPWQLLFVERSARMPSVSCAHFFVEQLIVHTQRLPLRAQPSSVHASGSSSSQSAGPFSMGSFLAEEQRTKGWRRCPARRFQIRLLFCALSAVWPSKTGISTCEKSSSTPSPKKEIIPEGYIRTLSHDQQVERILRGMQISLKYVYFPDRSPLSYQFCCGFGHVLGRGNKRCDGLSSTSRAP
ncbi:hypothetical protein C8R45DRAFT_325282 [Mycena sanguinolenta]|nr:hypothetical protein C8R45DRAFT_325282 [Mycena sanguinolenta]